MLDDLAWHMDHQVQKCAKLHRQQSSTFGFVLWPMPGGDRQHWNGPCFQCPYQRCHHHVRAVAQQVVRRSTQGANTALQLRDQILLITSLVAVEDDLLCGDGLVVVTDVEETADFIEQYGLALFFGNTCQSYAAKAAKAVLPIQRFQRLACIAHHVPTKKPSRAYKWLQTHHLTHGRQNDVRDTVYAAVAAF